MDLRAELRSTRHWTESAQNTERRGPKALPEIGGALNRPGRQPDAPRRHKNRGRSGEIRTGKKRYTHSLTQQLSRDVSLS